MCLAFYSHPLEIGCAKCHRLLSERQFRSQRGANVGRRIGGPAPTSLRLLEREFRTLESAAQGGVMPVHLVVNARSLVGADLGVVGDPFELAPRVRCALLGNGEGVVGIPDVIDALKDVGFDGATTIEVGGADNVIQSYERLKDWTAA